MYRGQTDIQADIQTFFKNIYKLLHTQNIAHLKLAYCQGTAIAGAIIFTYKDRALYAYGAARKEKEYTKLCSNNLLLWH